MSKPKIILVGPAALGIALMHRLQKLAPDLEGQFVVVSNEDEPATPDPAPVVVPDPEPVAQEPLTFEAHLSCETHMIAFWPKGGDGSPIEFMGPGVTGWTTKTLARIDDAVWKDANSKTLTLYARQSGKEISIVFPFREICPLAPAPGKPTPEPSLVDPVPVVDSRPTPVTPDVISPIAVVIDGTIIGTGLLD